MLCSGLPWCKPAGEPEGVGWVVAWLLPNPNATFLLACIFLYFDGVSMIGESGDVGTQSWPSRCRRWLGQRHCLLLECGGWVVVERGVRRVLM